MVARRSMVRPETETPIPMPALALALRPPCGDSETGSGEVVWVG